eukprot:5835990-Amphidinium_carterae.1
MSRRFIVKQHTPAQGPFVFIAAAVDTTCHTGWHAGMHKPAVLARRETQPCYAAWTGTARDAPKKQYFVNNYDHSI